MLTKVEAKSNFEARIHPKCIVGARGKPEQDIVSLRMMGWSWWWWANSSVVVAAVRQVWTHTAQQ